MLSKVFALQPVRQSTRLYSASSTHFLKDFMTSKEKGPVQLAIETKVNYSTLYFILVLIRRIIDQ